HLFTSYPAPAIGMRMLEFAKPPLRGPGQYAFPLRVTGKYDCGVSAGPHGDTSPGGKAYFIALPTPPVWMELCDAGGTRDLAFQAYLRPLWSPRRAEHRDAACGANRGRGGRYSAGLRRTPLRAPP